MLNDRDNDVLDLAFSACALEEGRIHIRSWLQMAGGSLDNINADGLAEALDILKMSLS